MPTIQLDHVNTKITDTYLGGGTDNSGAATLQAGITSPAFFKFDLGLIPNNAIIESASLVVTQIGATTAATIKAHKVLSDWQTGAWQQSPGWNSGAIDPKAVPGQNAQVSLNIKDLVQTWVNGENYGVGVSADALIYIGSSENGTGAYRPYLSVTYSLPTTGKKPVEVVGSKLESASQVLNINMGFPVGMQANDLLVAFINYRNSGFNLPSGWTLLYDTGYSGANIRQAVIYKTTTGTENTTQVSFYSGTTDVIINTFAFRNTRAIGLGAAVKAVGAVIQFGNNPVTAVKDSLIVSFTAIANAYVFTTSQNFKEHSDSYLGTSLGHQIQYSYNHKKTSYGSNEILVSAGGGTSGGMGVIYLEPMSNTAPNTPIINNPKGTAVSPAILTSLTPLFDWSHSDPDVGDAQSAFQLRIKKASDNSIVHNTNEVVSALTDYQTPAGVLQANELYYWEVTTKDKEGLSSAYSSAEYFKIIPPVSVGDKYNFNLTGAIQQFTVPGNVTKIKLEAHGARGGAGQGGDSGAYGGNGGYATGVLNVTPGQPIYIFVGGKGADGKGDASNVNAPAGGFNGGGNGGKASTSAYFSGGGGGGATDFRIGNTGYANRILVAGGGGGGATNTNPKSLGGAGGGATGASSTGMEISTGGTQSAGGKSGGGLGSPTNGALGTGGNGSTIAQSMAHGGGGGGGGYYGGGGGGSMSGGTGIGVAGGGGSGYIDPSLANALTGSNSATDTGNGLATITIVETIDANIAFVNRDPGTNDQLMPEGTNPTPLLTWDYSAPAFVQAKFQAKIYDLSGVLVHDSTLVTSTAKQYQVPDGVLTPGVTYGWEITGQNAAGASVPSNRIYFITNRAPGSPTPSNPADNYRTGLRPTFWATIGDDVENDNQKFVIQIAEDVDFTAGVQERNSETALGGWEAKTIEGTYGPLTAEGVDASYEGGTVKYTWSTNLVEGKTYYWRIAGIDATTGARGSYSAARRIRVGNKIDTRLEEPIITSAPIQRLLIQAQYLLATDGANPATVKFEATNNALDTNPTWEDVTAAVVGDDYYVFINNAKTAADWAFDLRVIFEANDSLEPIEFYGFGISFD
ncbi:glycine-rich protein [Metabacillus fastidiosus]|uniref:glycine-rich protein n=1 Tax=Metabacillus fastidiosus TaxID=1458 RepID=UPI003D2B740A